jgi:hypothetical protein
MIDDGLFERFKIDAVYGLHNLPGLPEGVFSIRPGSLMASESSFEIILKGGGGHAAMPHLNADPLIAGAQVVLAIQAIVSRQLSAIDEPAVISVTEFITNGTVNVIPSQVIIKGDCRCFNDTTLFWPVGIETQNIDSLSWNFDDLASGLQNTSTLINPYHIFSNPGNYNVQLTIYSSGEQFSISKNITIHPLPQPELGNDTVICGNQNLVLNPEDFETYLWQDESTDATFTVTETGLYWVEVENEFGCSARDSIDVVITMGPEIWLGNDSTLCIGDTILLCADGGYPDYLWQDGSMDSCLTVTENGNYWVEGSDEFGCSGYDTISLTFLPSPDVSLGNDTLLCFNEFLLLDAGEGYENYLWQDGSGGQTFLVTQSGEYWVEVDNECGFGSDTISIDFTEYFDIWLGNDTSL